MSFSIQTLPIAERWSCHSCGFCCRSTKFGLSDRDLRKLHAQQWERHPDFRGIKIITKHGLFKKYYQLGKKPDGSCVFLTVDNRCRIHNDFGESEKPLICRMFPFQLIPLDKCAFVTLRQYCPSAVANKGCLLSEQLEYVANLAEEGGVFAKPITPPLLISERKRSWDDLHDAAKILERMILDKRYTMVRRLLHGLEFCNLVEHVGSQSNRDDTFVDSIECLAASVVDDKKITDYTDCPRPPIRAAGVYFRQILFEYLHLHPDYRVRKGLTERWRLLCTATAFAGGKGRLKQLDEFPAASFQSLEQPLPETPEEIWLPFNRFFEKEIAARQFLLLGDKTWTLFDCFRMTAISYAVALWILRLTAGPYRPDLEMMFKTIRTIDRGQGYDLLLGARNKRRIRFLSRLGEIERILAWYAR
jgi:lysine-N-methylase